MEPSTWNTADHDLLIELKTTMHGVRDDIKGIKDDLTGKVADHETRIRSLEEQKNKWIGKESMVGGAIGVMASLISAWVTFHK